MAKATVKQKPSEYAVPIEQAIARLGKKKRIHTFMQANMGLLIGADHSRGDVIASMKEFGVEEAGEAAAKTGHTLVIRNYKGRGPLFIEAKPQEKP